MILTELRIHNVRNISIAQINLNSRFNFITGPNGSGKTSIIEALYLLSCGHSFRSREISPIIKFGEDCLTVFAKSLNSNSISIQKSCSNPTQIKLNSYFCTSTSQLAYALPCQIFYSDIFQIIDAGPTVRRSLLDWGLFHVKPNYLALLKQYKNVLKQRNALLKQHASYEYFVPWDTQLNNLAYQLDIFRDEYFKKWEYEFKKVLHELSDIECSIRYYKGWDRKKIGKNLAQVLLDSFESDKQKLYTQFGTHQADIIIETHQCKAKQYLSRGQQKIILIALKLAQGNLLSSPCLYLIDDLVAELDIHHQKMLMNYLAQNNNQFVITSTMSLDAITSELSDDVKSSFEMNNGFIQRSS